ncbi:unnamed protein product [Orchesella dallaii]|uniref:Uncharacterized protein n=1 Tax=Orchesella dallaii TaxID=48710 RepID=A0ABP1SAG8_9HEXA
MRLHSKNQIVLASLSAYSLQVILLYRVVSVSSEDSNAKTEWLEFTHEKCQKEVLTSNQYRTFYEADEFYGHAGVFEMLVRFKGIADGHVILTTNASSDEPRYAISLGSYNNRFSEIRRIKPVKVETKVSTPSIMSDFQFRGFLITYDPRIGHLSVFGEGSDVALLHFEDTNDPLQIRYFGFATWHNRIVQVAFNCVPKDSHSTADLRRQGGKSAEELRAGLLEHYDPKISPPAPLSNGVVSVGINLILNYFSVEEVEHMFLANVWLSLSWEDPRLSWNISEVNGSFVLRFSSQEIWKPDITLFNNAYAADTDHYGDTFLMVYPDGKVKWTPPARLLAHCKLNLIRWPYDRHTCYLKFGSWTHSGAEIDLKIATLEPGSNGKNGDSVFRPVDEQLFIQNSEWELIRANVSRDEEFYACCEYPYVVATYSFEFQRNSPSYVATIVIPIIVISIVNIMVFILPPTAGEKITLASINSFILCVYLIYFHSTLPALGDQLPLLVLMFSCNLVLVGISLIMSVIVINLARVRRASSPPQFFRMFCNAQFAQFLGLGHIVPYVSQTHTRLDEGVEMRSPHENSRSSLNFDKEDQTTNLVVEYDAPYMANAEWILLASMIDRLTLIVYSVVCGITLALCLA